jgi:hypothetical protein
MYDTQNGITIGDALKVLKSVPRHSLVFALNIELIGVHHYNIGGF